MTDYPGQASTTHDTTALLLPQYGPPAGGPVPDEAGMWAQKYRRERRRTRALTVAMVAALVVAAGLGVPALTGGSTHGTPTAAQAPDVTDPGTAGAGTTGAAPNGTAPQEGSGSGALPPGSADSQAPGGTGTSPQLPESLRGLGSALGITDVDDLIDLAVRSDLIDEERAEQLRAAVTVGSAVGDALSGGQEG